MDIIFEVVLDVIFELYDDILTFLMPNRVFSKKTRVLMRLLCAVVTLINVSLLFLGVYFIINKPLSVGLILTFIGGALILGHVILAIILHIKTSRRE